MPASVTKGTWSIWEESEDVTRDRGAPPQNANRTVRGVRKTRHDVVSVRQAEAAVLAVMKHCPVSKRELVIAASAVAHGLGIVFDAQQYPSHFSLSH